MLEVIEKCGRVHSAIVILRRVVRVAYNGGMPHDHSPQRIVCLQPSATVILDSLGELRRVVACTKYCVDVVPSAADADRVIVADSWTAKADEILAAHPDLVIAAVPYQEAAVSQILKAGVRFVGLAPRTLKDIYGDIALIAGTVDRSAMGMKVVSQMQAAIADVGAETAKLPRKNVFCEEWGKPIIASQPWVAELVEAAGGEFVGEPGKQISAEALAEMDPDVLIAAWCGAGDRVPLAKIVQERGWENLRAAKSGQVYCISDELLNTPAPTLVGGLRALAAAIHPGTFRIGDGLRRVITDVRGDGDVPLREVV